MPFDLASCGILHRWCWSPFVGCFSTGTLDNPVCYLLSCRHVPFTVCEGYAMSIDPDKLQRLAYEQITTHDHDIVKLPSQYSEAHEKRLQEYRDQLFELEQHFRRLVEPIHKAMMVIEMQYPPRYMVVPRAKKDTT
jgi:hypothetical protein